MPWSRSGSQRNSLQLSRNSTQLRRPDLTQRVSSWAGLINGSSDGQPTPPQERPRTSLKQQLYAETGSSPSPVDILDKILESSRSTLDVEEPLSPAVDPDTIDAGIDFGDLSLEEFVRGSSRNGNTESGESAHTASSADPDLTSTVDTSRAGLEDLHKSIQSCDDILVSVEKHLTAFQADLAAVSSEIETLQNKSTDLSERLERRKNAEKKLSPEVDKLIISPAVVRKISEGALDEGWARALQDLEKALKFINNPSYVSGDLKSVQDIRPLLESLKDRAVERVRDHIVAQIRALRSPNINAQVLQRNALGKFREAYSFLARQQPKLEEEIAQAYVNTMRWYYLSHFTRYKTSLEKLKLHSIEKTDTIVQDESAKRAPAATASRSASGPFDAFSLGRRIDILQAPNPHALSSFIAEEDKGTHFLETPFRAFNLALTENAAAEFSFMTEFFSNAPFYTVSKRFLATMEPTLALGQALTKHLVETSSDALGILICVRLNQHFAFEMQRRQVSATETYINGTSMTLWPRFQIVMDLQCDALKKASGSATSRSGGTGLSLTSSSAAVSSAAPHPITQRFANFAQGILSLSRDAGDDEPVQRSLSRLSDEFQGLLTKLGKSVADAKKRERFIVNNASLVLTIVGDCEGKMATDFKQGFTSLTEKSSGQ